MGSRTDRVRAGGTLQHSFPVARGPIGLHSRQGGTRNPQPTPTVRVGVITTRGRRANATLPQRDMSHVLPSATAFAWGNDCTGQRGDCSGSRLLTSNAPRVRAGSGYNPRQLGCVPALRRKPNSRELSDPHEQLNSIYSQCIVDGPGVPSDHVPTKTMKTVTRASGSLPAITGEPGRLAPQLFAASPETKNITWGCQFMPSSVKYCCFPIM
jgi:hypothetical protein